MDSFQEILARIRDFFVSLFASFFPKPEPEPITAGSGDGRRSSQREDLPGTPRPPRTELTQRKTSSSSSHSATAPFSSAPTSLPSTTSPHRPAQTPPAPSRAQDKPASKVPPAMVLSPEVNPVAVPGPKAPAVELTEEQRQLEAMGLDPQIIDQMFLEIISMDQEDDNSFSQELVFSYFKQARETIKDIQKSFAEKRLKEVSEKGHFLKSSSGTMGVHKLRDLCEKIQNYGALKSGGPQGELNEAQAIELLEPIISRLSPVFEEAEAQLMKLYK